MLKHHRRDSQTLPLGLCYIALALIIPLPHIPTHALTSTVAMMIINRAQRSGAEQVVGLDVQLAMTHQHLKTAVDSLRPRPVAVKLRRDKAKVDHPDWPQSSRSVSPHLAKLAGKRANPSHLLLSWALISRASTRTS